MKKSYATTALLSFFVFQNCTRPASFRFPTASVVMNDFDCVVKTFENYSLKNVSDEQPLGSEMSALFELIKNIESQPADSLFFCGDNFSVKTSSKLAQRLITHHAQAFLTGAEKAKLPVPLNFPKGNPLEERLLSIDTFMCRFKDDGLITDQKAATLFQFKILFCKMYLHSCKMKETLARTAIVDSANS